MTPRAPERNFRRVIASRLPVVDAVCLDVRAFLAEHNLGAHSFPVELLARECLNNAIKHGHRNRAAKKVRLELRLGRRWLQLSVADEGAGFKWRQAGRKAVSPTATSGRGIPLIRRYADRVRFNRRGNQITLWLALKQN